MALVCRLFPGALKRGLGRDGRARRDASSKTLIRRHAIVRHLWPGRCSKSRDSGSTANVADNQASTPAATPDSTKGRARSQLAAGCYIRLAASDDGCGLDPRAREHLFESYFTTKGPDDGNGLGLATAAEVMRAAGGAIRLAKQPGQGTAFHLYFPIG